MKMGFPPNRNTIGGRIRIARRDAGYTIKDFAALVDIAPNHLGLVERGEKQPSTKLLRRIAQASETDYRWLVKGDAPSSKCASTITNVPYDPTKDVDMTFFLKLALASVPSLDKETAARLLGTDENTIDKILDGESAGLEPWPTEQIQVLAHALGDASSLRKNLHGILQLLESIESDEHVYALGKNIAEYLQEKHGCRYNVRWQIDRRIHKYARYKLEVKSSTVWLYESNCPSTIWRVSLLQPNRRLDQEMAAEIIMGAQPKPGFPCGNLILAVTSPEDYDAFSQAARDTNSLANEINDGLKVIELESVTADMPYETIAYALADEETMTIKTASQPTETEDAP